MSTHADVMCTRLNQVQGSFIVILQLRAAERNASCFPFMLQKKNKTKQFYMEDNWGRGDKNTSKSAFLQNIVLACVQATIIIVLNWKALQA